MTSDDIRKIGDLVEQKIQSALEPIHQKLDDHSDKLDNHTASLVTIENTLKGYSDMYEINKDKTRDLDERVTVIEDHLGLAPAK